MGPPRPHTPGHFFLGEKVTKTPPGTPRSPILCPIGLYRVCNCGATESGFWHLICGGSINDASAAALLMGYINLVIRIGESFNAPGMADVREVPKHSQRKLDKTGRGQ